MEELQKELEEMRSAMEKLSEEHRAKSILSEGLKRAHDEQLTRLQEAKVQIEKQSREINMKAEEISLAKQMYEDLKSSFCQKESALKQLSLVNENLKTSYKEKSVNLETQNKELLSTLDEANEKREEQERMICAYKEEIERLKGLLSLTQRKCSDAEERAQAPKELRKRDEMLFKLEEEKGKVEDQLKWKSEQFSYLEEAHSKAQNEFRAAKKEWELERSNLFDEINTLQMNLESQTRVVNDLRSQLQMCNQALAHEESWRKLLEIKISESKALYENVVMEYEETKSKIETLTTKRDEQVAALRISLATKATLLKETEFSRTHLELENQELRKSLKEFQEAQINGADSASSLRNLRQRFRVLEQAHIDCSKKLKAKEAEWTTRTEKLRKDLDECLAKLSFKDELILELQVELEGSYSLLMQQKLENEEISIIGMILESKFTESCSNLEKSKLELELCTVKFEDRIAILVEQVERNDRALVQSQDEIRGQHKTVDSLHARIDYSESIEQEYLLMQKELDSYRGMLEGSPWNLDHPREQSSQKVNNLQKDLIKASDALDQANSPLAEKTSEMQSVEFELQQLITVVERMESLRTDLEFELAKCRSESNELRRDVEVSLLARIEAEKALVVEKERYVQITKEKDRIIEELQLQLVMTEEDFARREFEAATLNNLAIEKESKKLLQIAEVADEELQAVHTKLDFLEHKYEQSIAEASINLDREKAMLLSFEQELIWSVETSVALKLSEKQFEIDTVHEALEKTVTAHFLDEHEIQYKSIVIDEMEEEIDTLLLKLVVEEKQSFDLKDRVDRLEVEIAMESLERDKENVQAENARRSMQGDQRTLEDRVARLKSEREELVGLMLVLDDLIGDVHHNNEGLMRSWERVVKKAANEDDIATTIEGEELFSNHKEDEMCISLSRNKARQDSDIRLPLREHNC